MWCWGLNTNGRLGDGTTTQRTSPVQVGVATTWALVSAGTSHTCATSVDGTLWCWGHNTSGQLGDGTLTERRTPVRIGTGTGWTAPSAGGAQSCALDAPGTLWCWGNPAYGNLGDGILRWVTTTIPLSGPSLWRYLRALDADHMVLSRCFAACGDARTRARRSYNATRREGESGSRLAKTDPVVRVVSRNPLLVPIIRVGGCPRVMKMMIDAADRATGSRGCISRARPISRVAVGSTSPSSR